MKRSSQILTTLLASAFLVNSVFGQITQKTRDPHRIGGGVNYWVALEDLGDDTDDSGFSYLVSYQYWSGLWAIELTGELLPDRFGENAWAPEAYIIFGEGIYLAAGVGIINSDGDWASKPFYAFRGGFNFEVFGNFYLDISANYRFNDTADLKDSNTTIDTDTVFLGASLRFAF